MDNDASVSLADSRICGVLAHEIFDIFLGVLGQAVAPSYMMYKTPTDGKIILWCRNQSTLNHVRLAAS
jgi:hypothetical protein